MFWPPFLSLVLICTQTHTDRHAQIFGCVLRAFLATFVHTLVQLRHLRHLGIYSIWSKKGVKWFCNNPIAYTSYWKKHIDLVTKGPECLVCKGCNQCGKTVSDEDNEILWSLDYHLPGLVKANCKLHSAISLH